MKKAPCSRTTSQGLSITLETFLTSLESTSALTPVIRACDSVGRTDESTCMSSIVGNQTDLVLQGLARFDASKAEQLRIDYGDPSSNSPHRALLPMENLRTLTLHRCENPLHFIHALHPGMSPSGVVVCPKFEELVLTPSTDWATPGIKGLIGMAAARASRGAKLKSFRILTRDGVEVEFLELENYALHVECGPEVLMTVLVAMRKIEGDHCGSSLVSKFAFVFWMSILSSRHSITRAALPTPNFTITVIIAHNGRPCCRSYTSFHVPCVYLWPSSIANSGILSCCTCAQRGGFRPLSGLPRLKNFQLGHPHR